MPYVPAREQRENYRVIRGVWYETRNPRTFRDSQALVEYKLAVFRRF